MKSKHFGSVLAATMGSKFRSRYNKYLTNIQEMREAMNRIIHFGFENKFLVSSDLDNYQNKDEWKLKRIIMVTLTRVSTLLILMRFALIASIKSSVIATSMVDVTYLLGNQSLISMLFSMILTTFLFIEVVVQYQEMSQTFSVFMFTQHIRSEGMYRVMSPRNSRKIILITNFMAKFLLKPFYWIMFPVVMLVYLALSTTVLYNDSNWTTLVLVSRLCLKHPEIEVEEPTTQHLL